MKKNKFTILTCALSLISMSYASADDLTQFNVHKQIELTKVHFQQQIEQQQQHQRKIAWLMAPVKSKDALIKLSQQESVLDLLSDAAKQRLIDSIVFRNNGIGGFYFGDLEVELTPTQIYQVLSLFGAQHITSRLSGARVETQLDAMLLAPQTLNRIPDYKYYICASRGNCRKTNEDNICMSTC